MRCAIGGVSMALLQQVILGILRKLHLRRWPGELNLYLSLLLSETHKLSITNFRTIWLFDFGDLRFLVCSFAFSLSSSALSALFLFFNRCFGGREQTDGTFSPGFRRFSCPVGRSLFTGTFELRSGANLYGF